MFCKLPRLVTGLDGCLDVLTVTYRLRTLPYRTIHLFTRLRTHHYASVRYVGVIYIALSVTTTFPFPGLQQTPSAGTVTAISY